MAPRELFSGHSRATVSMNSHSCDNMHKTQASTSQTESHQAWRRVDHRIPPLTAISCYYLLRAGESVFSVLPWQGDHIPVEGHTSKKVWASLSGLDGKKKRKRYNIRQMEKGVECGRRRGRGEHTKINFMQFLKN